MSQSENRQIAIEAQLPSVGSFGGVQTQLAALVWALGQLDGPERYVIVCAPENPDWLRDFVGLNQSIVLGPVRTGRRLMRGVFGKMWPKVWAFGQNLWLQAGKYFHRLPPGWVWETNGFFEGLDVALVHVFYQRYLRTSLPVVFNPHDLQHEHYPEFFSKSDLAKRRYVYPSACRAAAAVVAASRYTRDDVIRCYQIPSTKVWTIPLGPATMAYEITEADCHAAAKKFDLSYPFMFYPAVTWKHKNHIRLLEAILQLKQQGLQVNLVCSGAQMEPAWTQLKRFLEDNQLGQQVRFLGYVSNQELRAIYRLSRFVIAPSLFEQSSGPMFEAWREGVPVAASNVTSLPDQAGGAALLFDPLSIGEIATAIQEMWLGEDLRHNLSQRGRQRLGEFSWERTAKAYRALYRHIAGWPMNDEDRELLGWDWMTESHKTTPALQPT